MGNGGIKSVLFVTHFMIGIKYHPTHVNSAIKVENRSQHALITSLKCRVWKVKLGKEMLLSFPFDKELTF